MLNRRGYITGKVADEYDSRGNWVREYDAKGLVSEGNQQSICF